MRVFRWTVQTELAAHLLAGSQSIAKTSKDVGVNETTIDRWKRKQPEFQARIDTLTEAFTRCAEEIGLARRSERIRQLKARHRMLRRIVARRSKQPEMREYLGGNPGLEAGLMCIRRKGKKGDQLEFAVDIRLLAELRRIEAQIATEVGDRNWRVERAERQMEEEPPPEVVALAEAFRPDELAEIKRRLEEAAKRRDPAGVTAPPPDRASPAGTDGELIAT